jgi:hypothetical protein
VNGLPPNDPGVAKRWADYPPELRGLVIFDLQQQAESFMRTASEITPNAAVPELGAMQARQQLAAQVFADAIQILRVVGVDLDALEPKAGRR